jgi:DNA-binding NtrC family response regulator
MKKQEPTKKDDSAGFENHSQFRFKLDENDPPPRVLVLAKDEGIRESVSNAMRESAFEVISMTHGGTSDALTDGSMAKWFAHFDVLVIDVSMSGAVGLEWIDKMRERRLCPAVVVISAFFDERIYEEADRLGCVSVFKQPFSRDQLIHTVGAATTWSRALLAVGYPGMKEVLASAS